MAKRSLKHGRDISEMASRNRHEVREPASGEIGLSFRLVELRRPTAHRPGNQRPIIAPSRVENAQRSGPKRPNRHAARLGPLLQDRHDTGRGDLPFRKSASRIVGVIKRFHATYGAN